MGGGGCFNARCWKKNWKLGWGQGMGEAALCSAPSGRRHAAKMWEGMSACQYATLNQGSRSCCMEGHDSASRTTSGWLVSRSTRAFSGVSFSTRPLTCLHLRLFNGPHIQYIYISGTYGTFLLEMRRTTGPCSRMARNPTHTHTHAQVNACTHTRAPVRECTRACGLAISHQTPATALPKCNLPQGGLCARGQNTPSCTM